MKLTINVTKQDIEMGCVAQPSNCPIARAVRRVLREMGARVQSYSVSVGTNYLDIFTEDKYIIGHLLHTAGAPLPAQAHNFIMMFDIHKPTKPFSFEIELSLNDGHSWGELFAPPVLEPALERELVEV